MLSTTSYAVLGMLAVRPWSAYDLTKQMRRSLAYCWPKAESVLYDEPKRLVRHGLATAVEEPGEQGRSRAVYSITDEGREVLSGWLATEPATPRFELEPMLRLLYADHGSTDDLMRALATLRDWAHERTADGMTQIEDYRETGGPFPERLHIRALFGDLVTRLLDTLDGWAADAEREVAAWQGTSGPGAGGQRTGVRLDEMIDRMYGTLTRSRPADAAPPPDRRDP